MAPARRCGPFEGGAHQLCTQILEAWPRIRPALALQAIRRQPPPTPRPAGARALADYIREFFADEPVRIIFGAMRDKAISEMTEILFPLAAEVIATRPENPRAASAQEIREAASRTGTEVETIPEVRTALETALARCGKEAVVVVTGSIYLVGEAMRVLELRI